MLKKSVVSLVTAAVSAFSFVAPAAVNLTANAEITRTSGILEEVQISALQNESDFYYVTKVTPERYFLKQFGHKPKDNCFVYVSDVQEYLREDSEMPQTGDLIYADPYTTIDGKLCFSDFGMKTGEWATDGIINYGSASEIFGADTFEEMQSVCDLYYIDWRANLNPAEMLDENGNQYVFTNKDELLADIEKGNSNEWMSRYFVVIDPESRLCYNLNEKFLYYVYKDSIDFGSETLKKGDLLYADFEYVLETAPGQIPANHLVNYGNASPILGTDIEAEISAVIEKNSWAEWGFNKPEKAEKDLGNPEDILKGHESIASDYAYVVYADEYGFILHDVNNGSGKCKYLSRDFYDEIITPDVKDFEVGDIVKSYYGSHWADTNPETICNILHSGEVMNFGSAYDLIGGTVDVQAEIDGYWQSFSDTYTEAPEKFSTLSDFGKTLNSGKGDYYRQHILYVNSYENGRYTLNWLGFPYNWKTGEYDFTIYEDSFFLYDSELDTLKSENRDDFEAGDIIFVNWYDMDGALRVNHYSTVRNLGNAGEIQNGTAEVPEVMLKTTIKTLADNPADINSDLRTSIADAVMLQNYLLGRTKLDSAQAERADVNNSGNVDIFDMVTLKQIITNG